MIRVPVGRGSPRHRDRQGEPNPADDIATDRVILSFTLLLAMLLSGVVISLAEAPPQLSFDLSHVTQN